MSGQTASSSTGGPAKEPSAGDVSFMVHLFMNMHEKPAIDWDAFAAAAGFKNAGVAQVRYGQIKRKFSSNEVGPPTTPKKKAAGEGPGSAKKVTKSSGGRVGTKGKKGKEALKAEDEDVDVVKVKTETSTFKLEDKS